MTKDICEEMENDEFYHHFLAQDKTSDLTSSLSFSDQISKLSEGLEIISTELQSQVREQYGALISQANHAGKLNSAIDSVSSAVDQLASQANKLRNQINQPFSLLETQTKVLGRLGEASHILRQTGRFLQLVKKLKSANDLVEKASILFELETLMEDEDLSRIEFIREDKVMVLTEKQRLVNTANKGFSDGLRNSKFDLVKNSIEIFYNLQTLGKCLDHTIETFIGDIKHSIRDCFAGNYVSSSAGKLAKSSSKSLSKGPGKAPNLITSQHFRSKLWTSLEAFFDDEVFSYCQQIAVLHKCLSSLYSQDEYKNIDLKFWKKLEKLLQSSFESCQSHVMQCLQQDLPKLLSSVKNLEMKLDNQFQFSDSIFKSLEAGYLEKCANNLKAVLTGMDFPNQEFVDNLIRAASSEFNSAIVDPKLSSMVAGVFCVCNKDLWTKIEGHLNLGAEVQQIVGATNASQQQNASLANLIFYHGESVQRMISNLGNNFSNTEASGKLLKNLNEGRTITLAILQQLTASITHTANVIFLSMHREQGLNSGKLSSLGPSAYMIEFQDFLQRSWNTHVVPFNDKQNVEQCAKDLASKCIELFVQNLAVLRPLSSAGRLRLKSDCGHLENALKKILPDMSSLGQMFRLLRAISTLITLPPENLIEQTSDIGTGVVQPHIVLLMLFGHAGTTEMQSPHITANWGVEKLIKWLDDHSSEREKLELITGALLKYRNVVREKNIAQYDPVYPMISSYLENAIKIV